MATHVFFTSYARLDNADSKLTSAIDELTRRVAAKFGENVKPFFDTTDLKNGVEWEEKLGAALKETRVVLCLCSPAYLKSAFCAKEFDVFRQRVEAVEGDTPVAIIPVIWEPTALPQAIRRFHQDKDPRFPSDYPVAGLSKYIRLKSQADNLVEVIEVIAEDIDRADKKSKLTTWEKAVKYDELPDSFHNPRPVRYGASLTVLDANKSRWKPGHVRSTIGTLFDEVVQPLNVPWEDVPADAVKLLGQLEQREESRLASIYVVERDAALQPPWNQMLKAIDGSPHRNFAVVVGWKKTDLRPPSEMQQEIQKLLPDSSAAGAFHDWFTLDDEDACRTVLTRTLTAVRMALVEQDDPARVQSDVLRDGAIGRGIPVDSIASLPSPGAQQP